MNQFIVRHLWKSRTARRYQRGKRYSQISLRKFSHTILITLPPNPRLTNSKTRVCVLINFTYESVKYLYFLRSGAVGIFDGFVYDYFLDERIEHFSGQFRGLGVLLD